MFISKKKLNKLYTEVYNSAEKISNILSQSYKTNITFGNKNFEIKKGKWICNYFPIPVIEINKKVDLNIDMFNKPYYFELCIQRDKIKNFDIVKFTELFKNKNLYIYGGEDCLIDFFFKDLPIDEVKKNMLDSNQKSFGFSFETSYDIEIIQQDLKDILSCYDR